MAKIKYVSLSDLHLGEEDSLLTALKDRNTRVDTSKKSPVLVKLAECLKELITKINTNGERPALILNGDILEMALCRTNEAAMVFDRFLEALMPKDGELFSEIFYIPGNHDHHLWELARETQYVNFIDGKDASIPLDPPWHTTNMFFDDRSKPPSSYFLNALARRHPHLKEKEKKGKFDIKIAYPNFGILSDDNQRNIIFSHGHYIEPLYHLMSTLRSALFPNREKPGEIWELEGENFAWIDFFWSTMGRSGGAGQDIELIYEKMQDEKGLKELFHNLARYIAENVGYDWSDWLEAKAIEKVLDPVARKITNPEKKQTDKPLSKRSKEGLEDYMEGPLVNQILHERHIANNVTFVFGHTHKPFETFMNFTGYRQPVNVYNTGGWIVETVNRMPLHGGSIVLVDNELNSVSVRMYNESKDERNSVSVRELSQGGPSENPLFKEVNKIVRPGESIWKEFSDTISEEIDIRAEKLKERIHTPG